jgi:hypothetical protein
MSLLSNCKRTPRREPEFDDWLLLLFLLLFLVPCLLGRVYVMLSRILGCHWSRYMGS